MPTTDWTVPESYFAVDRGLDRLAADAAARHINEALSAVDEVLDVDADAPRDTIAERIDLARDAMTAFMAVDCELASLRRGREQVRIVEALRCVAKAHRGVPGIEGGVGFEAADEADHVVVEPTAAWIVGLALSELIREQSRRGPVQVRVDVEEAALALVATTPRMRIRPPAARACQTTPFVRRLARLLKARFVRRRSPAGTLLALVIPLGAVAA